MKYFIIHSNKNNIKLLKSFYNTSSKFKINNISLASLSKIKEICLNYLNFNTKNKIINNNKELIKYTEILSNYYLLKNKNKFCCFNNQIINFDFNNLDLNYLKNLIENTINNSLTDLKKVIPEFIKSNIKYNYIFKKYNYSLEKLLLDLIFIERTIYILYICTLYTRNDTINFDNYITLINNDKKGKFLLNSFNINKIYLNEFAFEKNINKLADDICYNLVNNYSLNNNNLLTNNLNIKEEALCYLNMEYNLLKSIKFYFLNKQNISILNEEKLKKIIDNNCFSLTNIILCLKFVTTSINQLNSLAKKILYQVNNIVKYNSSNNISLTFNEKDKIDNIILDLYFPCKNLSYLNKFIIESCLSDKNDIFNLSFENSLFFKNNQNSYLDWKTINDNSVVYKVLPKTLINLNTTKIYNMLEFITVFVSKINPIKSTLIKAFYYLINRKALIKHAKIYYTNMSLETTKSIWNMMDNKVVIFILKLFLPPIEYSKNYYFKKIKKEIKINEIIELSRGNNFIDKSHNENQIDMSLEKIPNKYICNSLLNVAKNFNTYLDKSNYVKVKIINSKVLIADKYNNKNNKFNDLLKLEKKSIIIHIHGGGFIAMSPDSHEYYLRKWSILLNNALNNKDVPIFSIYYSLSPEKKYPKALDDVYQAYISILENAKSNLLIDIEKVIVIGDSAGGSLAMGLINLIINKNFKVPDGLFLIYPCMRLDNNYFSPSKLISLNDKLLRINLLKILSNAYLEKNINIPNDYFLNPILTPNNVR